MKYLYLFVLIFTHVICHAQSPTTMDKNTKDSSSGEKTFIGVARNAKAGACLEGDKGEVYFIEGLNKWDHYYLDKRLAVKGILIVKEQNEPLKNEKGEYKSGSQGDMEIIRYPVLPKTNESIALIVVFKKEIGKKTVDGIIFNIHYPHSKGMDSSKGKSYYANTGEKYIILFPTEAEKALFKEQHKHFPEIYEIYQPDWAIVKD